ncbi:MAG: phosphodiester glycosidase family protein [Hydrogenibacillus schlegelii]|uniref:Phosphodiester glycosidase family protein n=1 Tax=Hydrogenibacillus schlegelii TaxID=1484 RepID=A0A947CZG1_HYDSH|nr:phosphodiester glycosidase family protein [Hydrogenibacillus schlegelii]
MLRQQETLTAAFDRAEAAARARNEAVRPLQAHAEAIADHLAAIRGGEAPIREAGEQIRHHLETLRTFADDEKNRVAESAQAVQAAFAQSRAEAAKTKDALDTILAKKLGDPIGQTFGRRATIKVFSLKEVGYRGYMAKVKLHDPSAVRLVMAEPLGDDLGSPGETVLSIARRTKAALAINAGGFFRKNGLIYPIGNTVSGGRFISVSDNAAVSFIGFDAQGRLVGGPALTRADIERLGVREGASFLPTLIKDGKPQPIPKDWAGKKEPRTLIGHFTNGDVLMVVIDGRQTGYSEGVTLEDAREKLLGLNIRDAYNLDGGGSSTFVYNGRVLNRPSDGRPRPVISAFVILP